MGKNKITRSHFINILKGLGGLIFLFPDNPYKRELGKTGIGVSPLCFGATGTTEPAVIRYACEKGINFIDTGRSYSNGNNEALVGNAIAGSRKDFVVLSKLRLEKNELLYRGKGLNGSSEIKKTLEEKTRLCLNALRTDYLDILLFHDAMDEDLLFHPATLEFFNLMKHSGIIRAHGFSINNSHLNLAERNNSEVFYNVIMIPYNQQGCYIDHSGNVYSSFNQEKQISVLSDEALKGVGIIAMKPVSGRKTTSEDSELKWIAHQKIISSTVLPIDSFENADRYAQLFS